MPRCDIQVFSLEPLRRACQERDGKLLRSLPDVVDGSDRKSVATARSYHQVIARRPSTGRLEARGMRVPFTAALAALTLIASTGVASTASTPVDPGRWLEVDIVAQPLRPSAQAPADEYFGVQRLSNLGIRSMLHDMMIEGTSPLALPLQMQRMAGIESAFPPW